MSIGWKHVIPVLVGALGLVSPARASCVAFEDESFLSAGQWQLNSILSCFPNTLTVTAQGVSALPAQDASLLLQFGQEIRYGVSDRLMVRTTVPLSWLRENAGAVSGLGDWEAFAKYWVLGDAQADLNVALGLQVLAPTSLPSNFGINGSWNVLPSLALGWKGAAGELHASLGYMRALDQRQDGKVIHPSDSAIACLGLCRDLADGLNATLDAVGSLSPGSLTDGVPDADSSSAQITLGPGLSWTLNDHVAFLASLQAPVLRQGLFAVSQPWSGLVMFSWTP